ncbi:sugar ABC transporter ATP-binding protein [Verminephrobacter eiseniae]|uniref:ABC transporter related n=3 Tax=Verminephrobacter eiseniae TaxID=364317 RepID=A1WQX5_VEREI|nr:sugar ABC transporter ATP-binding protein [Verminephrobacter eiseniae]ABM60032.1 ABC transporter related [Verminephrobacter eiseniae EF01-2]MCW5285532.1 sugar ABC transporter ATP-binding protein [Verminephrobacter eiseniae]MCW5303832.1 sugar ABC transporter ATP-binding protein [Verminephrobacter eiseniae]MCW8190976.1 sugar ABC transporter ATP-binding protein [Verminephrobacter eiseniae]
MTPVPAPPDAAVPFLEVRGVHKRFAGVHALRGVSLRIDPGRIYHLVGENGCGKSTLIKIISGAQPADEGELLIEGRACAKLTPIEALAAGIETVYQDLSLIVNLSVAENIALTEQLVHHGGRLARRLDRQRLAQTARLALATVNLPNDNAFLATQVGELPIAQRQLVAIARAIATRARMVIMDEPTTALTWREVDRLVRVIERLRAQGVSVLFVSHKLDECLAIGGEVIVLRDGGLVMQGPIREQTKASLSHLMTGKQLDEQRLRAASPGRHRLLQVRGLGRRGCFADIDLDLHQGEILGITGLLDSGRNELAQALAGVAPADRGQVMLGSRRLDLRTPSGAIDAGIGYVPQDRLDEGLFLGKPIADNIVAAVLARLCNRWGLLDGRRARALAERTVADLQVATPDVARPVQSLSGGNQQRVLIGRWLTIEPRVLVLHGPTVGVDVGSKDTIYSIIQRLADRGLGVLIISDDLPELLQNCDRVLVMRKGRLRAQYDAATLSQETLYAAMLAEETTERTTQETTQETTADGTGQATGAAA